MNLIFYFKVKSLIRQYFESSDAIISQRETDMAQVTIDSEWEVMYEISQRETDMAQVTIDIEWEVMYEISNCIFTSDLAAF